MTQYTHPINNNIKANSEEYENFALIHPTGFREYDVRWVLGEKLNLLGVQRLGFALGHLIQNSQASSKNNTNNKIIVGHDYRQYSISVKHALALGLVNAGIKVVDIGLAITPMLYFAQQFLKCNNGAMVTASHNENGWSGVKISDKPPTTFGPDKIKLLKDLVFNDNLKSLSGGSYETDNSIKAAYISDVKSRINPKRKLRIIAACGNGTAGAFVKEILDHENIDLIPMDANLDYNFPNYNPNPEDMIMLGKMGDLIKQKKADLAFGFDGDGDRCGVVDNNSNEIFSDKIGLLIARNMAKNHKEAKFVVDVKSTNLYKTDEILKSNQAHVDYYKTGHSYIKSQTAKIGAIAGFEKSGHFFLNPPYGRGYDDAFVACAAIIDLLQDNNKSLSELYSELPYTYQSPTINCYCDDEKKYDAVEIVKEKILKDYKQSVLIDGLAIEETNDINGIRFTLSDASFGLVRASSNKPELVIVIETPDSKERLKAIFTYIKKYLDEIDEIGEFHQAI